MLALLIDLNAATVRHCLPHGLARNVWGARVADYRKPANRGNLRKDDPCGHWYGNLGFECCRRNVCGRLFRIYERTG